MILNIPIGPSLFEFFNITNAFSRLVACDNAARSSASSDLFFRRKARKSTIFMDNIHRTWFPYIKFVINNKINTVNTYIIISCERTKMIY